MSRNLIIACDGTSNEFGNADTNVVRLIRSLDLSGQQQCLYYDPGLGTLAEPGFVTRLGQRVSSIAGLAFGSGLLWKVGQAYEFLMERWEPGDRVYLFGFSRGAYSVRVLGAFLYLFGLLPPGTRNLLPYAMRLFRASRAHLDQEDEGHAFWALVAGYRNHFARSIPDQEDRRFRVAFLGLWDTVSSVGWVWNPTTFPYTARNPGAAVIRHAVSIDERRSFFRSNGIVPAIGQDASDLWFPGTHCDVGGGHPEGEGGLWREPFRWMSEEAVAHGLVLDAARYEGVWTRSPPPAEPWLERAHESLTPIWWPAEFVPKMTYSKNVNRRWPALGLGRRRIVPDDAEPHRSTLLRMRTPSASYNPPNVPRRWRDLSAAPD